MGDTISLDGITNIGYTGIPLNFHQTDETDFIQWWVVYYGFSNLPNWVPWGYIGTNYAGGAAPEMIYMSSLIFGFNGQDAYTFPPLVETTHNEDLWLSFRHYLYHYSDSFVYNVSVEITQDDILLDPNGATWTTIWDESPVKSDIGPEILTFDLDPYNLDNSAFYLRFRLTGDDWGINYWFVDDVKVWGTPVDPPIYKWTANVGANPVPDNVLNPSVSPTQTTTYTLEVEFYGQTCYDTVTIEVEDCTPPCLDSLDLDVSHSPICYEEAFQLLATIVPDPSVNIADLVFSWVGPNGFTSNVQNPIVTDVGPNTSGTYTLTVSHINGLCIEEEKSIEVEAKLCYSFINSHLKNRMIKD